MLLTANANSINFSYQLDRSIFVFRYLQNDIATIPMNFYKPKEETSNSA